MDSFSRYKEDINKLCDKGYQLQQGLLAELLYIYPEKFKDIPEETKLSLKGKSFKDQYNSWYNESLSVIKQLIPERLDDFKSYYRKEKRKSLTYETYTISDYLIGLVTKNYCEYITLDETAAIVVFEQQLLIVTSLKDRFESSLYEIKQMLQADMFDSEISAAKGLLKAGFLRAAGAVTGVILEKHLAMVCENHNLISKKKTPSINDLNQLLKDNDIADQQTWRKIQFLGDIRNLCDHGKEREPNKENIEDLIEGTTKIMKTLF